MWLRVLWLYWLLVFSWANSMRASTSVALAPVRSDSARSSGFTQVPPRDSGLWFTNRLTGDAYLTNAVAHNGAGLAIGDVDGDGLPDIYVCNLQGGNALYRNLGSWRFAPSELGDAACTNQMSTGAVLVDVDGDRDLDVLVNGIGAGTRLFLNDGKGRFTEKRDSGLLRHTTATSMGLADMDGDSDLDLYCAHYIDFMHLLDPTTKFEMGQKDGRWRVNKVNEVPTTDPRYRDRFEVMSNGEVREIPEADALYRNDGQGNFTPIQSEPGVFLNAAGQPMKLPREWGLAVVFRDLNGDGIPDLYVSNDYASPDRIWFNDGRGHFREADPFLVRHTALNAMGVDVADVNRDGLDDIVVLDLLAGDPRRRMRQLGKIPPDPADRESLSGRPQFNRNMLFLGQPGGGYVETALDAGIAATDWSWCPVFLDVDLDGYEDLLVTTGFEFDLMDRDAQDRLKAPSLKLSRDQLKRSMQLHPRWRTPCHVFRNVGGHRFEPGPAPWSLGGEALSFGMALGDLDRDGDLDVVINCLNEPLRVFRNEATAGRIGVQLRGAVPNTSGIGARIRLLGPGITQSQEIMAGGRYLSGDQALRVFATELSRTNPLSLEVRWRSGRTSRVENVEPGHLYDVDEAEATNTVSGLSGVRPTPLFEDVSALVNQEINGAAIEDQAIQANLPTRPSRMCCGLAWADLDADGWEDLVAGAPWQGRPAIFRNQQGKAFTVERPPALNGIQRGMSLWVDPRGSNVLLVAKSNPAPSRNTPSEVLLYRVGPGFQLTNTSLVIGAVPIGALATGDIDGDGDLDLFVGGQSKPRHYPENVGSGIYLNEAGTLRPSGPLSGSVGTSGVVAGCVLADFDGDGDLDLALTSEWGPVRLYLNENRVYVDVTERMGLSGRTGVWSGIAAGDFDGDGRLDLAVANIGRNTGYALFRPSPIRLYFGPGSVPGRFELIESWQRGSEWFPIRNRSVLAAAFPDLETRFPTHEQFAEASVGQLLEGRSKDWSFLEINEFESGVLLNRGRAFEWHPLPTAAQWAPALSIQVGDVDGDGREDLFLSQNRSDLMPELSRDDNGRGQWLRGDGAGGFATLTSEATGIRVEGEQRGAALADFDHDGRLDVAVSQVNGPVRLFRNRAGLPGLRVVLQGSPGNPHGVGAQVRAEFEDGSLGPVKTIQGGTGLYSQDAVTCLLARPKPMKGIWVRWPNQPPRIEPIAPTQGEIRIRIRTE